MHTLKLFVPLGVALGYGLPLLNGPADAKTPNLAPVEEGCTDAPGEFEITAVPLEFADGQLEFGVAFDRAPADVSSGAFGVAVWDDQGQLQEAPLFSKPQLVKSAGFDETFRVSGRLSDGYYRVQILAAADTSAGHALSTETQVLFQVYNGETLLLSQEDWWRNSRVLVGRTAPAVPASAATPRNTLGGAL